MEAPKTIEHQIGGIQNDALRFGLHGVKSDLDGAHPLESALESAKVTQEQINRKILGYTYGSAFPLKMDLERQILSRFQRPAGPIPSSMLGLEAMTGKLDDFGFEDYLNVISSKKRNSARRYLMNRVYACCNEIHHDQYYMIVVPCLIKNKYHLIVVPCLINIT